jgi:hypothetical protein
MISVDDDDDSNPQLSGKAETEQGGYNYDRPQYSFTAMTEQAGLPNQYSGVSDRLLAILCAVLDCPTMNGGILLKSSYAEGATGLIRRMH